MGERAGKSRAWRVLGIVLAWALMDLAMAQGTTPAPGGSPSPAPGETINLDVLKGNWVRPDGGYTIAIRNIDPNGQIDATYFNPKQLPFAKARASREGATLRASFELRAGGYDGSTTTYLRSRERPAEWNLLPGSLEAEVRRLLRAEMSTMDG
jgi:hypothetical protein